MLFVFENNLHWNSWVKVSELGHLIQNTEGDLLWKKVLLASLLSFGIASIAQADIGVVKDGFGKIMQTEQFTVVKKPWRKESN